MKYKECNIDEYLRNHENGRKIFLFGAGANIVMMAMGPLYGVRNDVFAVLDNGTKKTIDVFGKNLDVYKPEFIKEHLDSDIIITSCTYMSEMVEQLSDMNLPDSVNLYLYSLMSATQWEELSDKQQEYLFDKTRRRKIPPILHGFWFGEDARPEAYQRCFDSWKHYCPSFEIKEWTKENYDYHKHPFIKKAIEEGAWAAATDFARVDVILEYGGVYMDMDVEVVKPLDGILGHESVFSFYSDGVVDPAAFAAAPHNKIVKEMRNLFDKIPIPENKDGFKTYYDKFFLPTYMSTAMVEFGVKMNGKYQEIDDNLFLPRYLMMPQDCAVYDVIDHPDTFMIHRANAGWKKDSYKYEKIKKNRKTIGVLQAGSE